MKKNTFTNHGTPFTYWGLDYKKGWDIFVMIITPTIT